MKASMKRSGFTMVELLVVIAITMTISSIAIIYGAAGQNQLTLSVESSKIAQLILQARELSIATYSEHRDTCGYGMHFDYSTSTGHQNYSLVQYDLTGPGTCPSLASTTLIGAIQNGTLAEQEYEPGSWQIPMPSGVRLVDEGMASDTIHDIFFYPPDPFMLVSLDGQTFLGYFTSPPAPAESNIYLETGDGSASRVISLNTAGQVSL
jgi:prepilin-type N-terminal cleavage/methylation domain-containing protein